MKRKILALVLVSVMLFSLAACGGKDEQPSAATPNSGETNTPADATDATDTSAEKEHFTLRMVRVGNIQDPTKDRILLELQKRLNFTLEIISIPWEQFPSQMQMMVATGDPIDLLMCSPDTTFYEWADADMLYSYEDLFKMGDYPLCESVVYSDMYAELANPSDGLHYGKAMATPTNAWGPVIRTDWLEKLGLDMPETIDDFYNVVKAFAEADLDGTDAGGVDIRIGGAQNDGSTLGIFGYIQRAFNLNPGDFNFIENDDGTLSLWNTTEGAKEAAKFIRKLMNEGLLNYDFATMPQESDQGRYADDFAAGRLGIGWTSNPGLFMEKLKAANPDATMAYLPPVTANSSVPKNSGGGVGYWYVHAIPKTCENPARVMEVLEYGLTNEGRELTLFGIEGIHWTDRVINEDGSRVYTIDRDECAKDWDVSANGLRYPMCWGFINYHAEIPYIPIEEYGNYDEAYLNAQTWVRDDQTEETMPEFPQQIGQYALNSPLLGSKDPRVQPDDWNATMSVYSEYWLKAIYAKSDEEFETAWDEMCTRLMDAGGQTLLDGGNELWAERN